MDARILSHYQASCLSTLVAGPRLRESRIAGYQRTRYQDTSRSPPLQQQYDARMCFRDCYSTARPIGAYRIRGCIQEGLHANCVDERAGQGWNDTTHSKHHGVQLLAMLQALGKQLATAALLALMLGLQATAIIMPPAAGSHELVAVVWDESEVASQTEDRLLEVLKAVGARVDSAVGTFTDLSHFGRLEQSQEAQQAAQEGQELIKEVWGVVADYYLDARGSGFDLQSWTRLRDKYLAHPLPTHDAAYRAIREMLAYGLKDPYTRFITPPEFEAMRKYDVTGVGLNLATAEEFTRKSGMQLPEDRKDAEGGVWVLGMIKGGAADRAGVRQGDEILRVNGQEIGPLSPFKVAGLMQGAESEASNDSDTFVDLEVRRKDSSLESVRIDRPKQTVPTPVNAFLEERGDKKVGYVHLTAFNARALTDVEAAVKSLEDQGAAELVLDLRDNRGGLVQEGIEIAKLFLEDKAPIVVTQSGALREERAVRAVGEPLTIRPLTILVNEHTASASEIFAGALRDNCRALLVGTKTYGKGLIQSVYELSDSSGLVLTVGKYLTPLRTDIDREGLKPDFRHMPSSSAAAEQLQACRLSHEA
ncbi:hypothetical protein CVIRNUC_001047 [Coccomyxa viridis]|uniref:PDZ domain-containing protein n=1 Tax=Coccomyxa viridis TaxID=1274662 RepID=A0AAV1HUB1_9CHLO|nr:hypothetical protein CVIRNUC_001047 [Coccomyxa viridis]